MPLPAPPNSSPAPRRSASPRRLLVVVLVILAVMGWVGYAVVAPEWRADRAIALAEQVAAEGDYDRARGYLDEVLKVRPASGQARFLMARTCRRADDLTAAAAHLREAKRLGWVPDAVEVEEHLIEAQEVGPRGPNEATLQLLALTHHPDERVILEALAKGYRNVHRPEAAVKWLGIWITRYPDDWLPRQWRGEILEAFNLTDDARADYQRALELRPAAIAARRRLGRLELTEKQNPAAAAEHFTAFLEAVPEDPDGLLGLAECRRTQGDPDGARGLLDRLLGRDPGNARGCLECAALEADAGRPASALTWMARAEAAFPDEPQPHYRLALLLARLDRPDDAARHMRRFHELDEGYRRIAALTKQLLGDPASADRRGQIGAEFLRLGRTESALAWFFSALNEDPGHRPTHRALAEHYQKTGQSVLAARHRQHAEGSQTVANP
ncbi:MAG: tetratricopeptide repeat protein [Gemmataceae bacterium]|nr:tetratricopeptide repeat protein [Gemmataceae bacterium]